MSDAISGTGPEVVSGSYSAYFGPAFVDGVPISEEWLNFINKSKAPEIHPLPSLWFEKAKAKNNIPLRKDFSFTELAKNGGFLAILKLTDDDRWLTTFCGNDLVSLVGLELTGQHLDEYSDEETLKCWCDSLKIMTEQSKPFLEYYDLEYFDKSFNKVEVVNLPLRSGSRDFADMFFSITSVIKNPA